MRANYNGVELEGSAEEVAKVLRELGATPTPVPNSWPMTPSIPYTPSQPIIAPYTSPYIGTPHTMPCTFTSTMDNVDSILSFNNVQEEG